MRALTLVALISVSLAAPAAAPQGRGGGQDTFTARADLVVFNVTVTNDRGRPVSGLQAGDFQVREDGRPQRITLFDAEDGPATVGLVVDDSGSMIDKREDVVTAALTFANASNANDEMFVVNFNEHASLGLPPSVPFTSNLGQIRAALLQVLPAGETALYDALAVGIEHVNAGTHARKALVVVSDGGDNASHRHLDDVLQSAERSSATIYTIGIYDEADRDRNPDVLRKIATATGGRAYFPQSLDDLRPIWREIAGAIRGQYTIGYYSTNPAHDGAFRRVAVAVGGHDGLRVTTRPGYRAPAGTLRAR